MIVTKTSMMKKWNVVNRFSFPEIPYTYNHNYPPDIATSNDCTAEVDLCGSGM